MQKNNIVNVDKYNTSTEKTFNLKRKLTNDVPEMETRLRDIDFYIYYNDPTYDNIIKFLREHYSLVCNWKYSETADYGEPAWIYQVYSSEKEGKTAKDAWSFETTENIFDWKEFYPKHPELDDNDEWEVIISAIDEMITRVENLNF